MAALGAGNELAKLFDGSTAACVTGVGCFGGAPATALGVAVAANGATSVAAGNRVVQNALNSNNSFSTGAGGVKLDPRGVPLKPGSSGGPTAEKKFDQDIKALVREENRATHDGKLTCVLCGRNDLVDPPQAVGGRQQQPNEAQVDHIISRHKGGNATQENGQVACPSCNQKKFQRERRL